jgi:hypothetical protein
VIPRCCQHIAYFYRPFRRYARTKRSLGDTSNNLKERQTTIERMKREKLPNHDGGGVTICGTSVLGRVVTTIENLFGHP